MKKEKNYKELLKNDLKNKDFIKFLKDLIIYSWKGDDIISYFLFFLIVFSVYYLLLKPLIYPIIFGNQIPINVIVSNSMEHDSPFTEWWDKYGFYYKTYFNITKEKFENFPYRDGLYVGDIVIVKNYPKKDIKLGDIIVYYVPSLKKHIIHRVVKIKEENNNICFETVGDNNVKYFLYGRDPQLFFEKNVCSIEGKVIFRIPYLGLPRYWVFKVLGI